MSHKQWFRSIRRTKIREQGEEAKKTDMASEKMISDNAFKDSVRYCKIDDLDNSICFLKLNLF